MNELSRPPALAGTKLKVESRGDTLALILPPELAARLEPNQGDSLDWAELPDGSLSVMSKDPRRAKIMAIARQVMAEYDSTFRELAR